MEPIYAFIGGGNMGGALIGGLINGGHPPGRIRVADPQSASRRHCVETFQVAAYDDNLSACDGAEVVVLAVKPQHMRAVAEGLAPAATDTTLYLSIAAGITVAHLNRWLGASRAIVRCMPNTPALVGAGAAALYANSNVTAPQRARASALLGAVGSASWIEREALMDAVTAVSGSGPAYFFLFIELIEKAAVEMGLDAELARGLALQTAYGAAKLALGSEHPPAVLREQVTSKGGTTAAALASFADAGLEAIVRRALGAARERSLALAAEVES